MPGCRTRWWLYKTYIAPTVKNDNQFLFGSNLNAFHREIIFRLNVSSDSPRRGYALDAAFTPTSPIRMASGALSVLLGCHLPYNRSWKLIPQ